MSEPTLFRRRDIMKLGAAAAAAMVAQGLVPKVSQAAYSTVTLEECVAMSPVEMAKRSGPVMASWKSLQAAAASIWNPSIRTTVQAILENPAPTIMKKLDAAAKKEVYAKLTAEGLLKDVSEADFLPPCANAATSVQPFVSAPGSGYQSHHAYPGGVVTHTDLNVKMSQALYEGYRDVYDYLLDRDVVLAAQLLHDLHKPWVFAWLPDGSSRTELPLAGTGEHHSLSVAESIERGLPAEVCVAQACAHNHPGFPADEAGPVNWIKAACVLVGKDPVKAGLLAADGKTLPLPRRMEGFTCHLGDHDWVLTVPAVKWTLPLLQEIATTRYKLSEGDLKGKPFNALRNYVFAQTTAMGLYQLYSTRGKDALTEAVTSIVRPA